MVPDQYSRQLGKSRLQGQRRGKEAAGTNGIQGCGSLTGEVQCVLAQVSGHDSKGRASANEEQHDKAIHPLEDDNG
jgi:hypothetical protein